MTLPAPLAVDGQVTHDPATRSVSVKVVGLGGTYWRRGHAALMKPVETGRYWDVPPTVFAHSAGGREIARGEPVEGGWLRFKLSPNDYRKLTSTPDLAAIVTVDRAGRILRVKFRQSTAC